MPKKYSPFHDMLQTGLNDGMFLSSAHIAKIVDIAESHTRLVKALESALSLIVDCVDDKKGGSIERKIRFVLNHAKGEQ